MDYVEQFCVLTDSKKMVAIISMVDERSRFYYGAPGTVTIEYICSLTGNSVLLIEYWILRVPEGCTVN